FREQAQVRRRSRRVPTRSRAAGRDVVPVRLRVRPQTVAEDGDPLDVIVLLDAPVYPGCVVPARVIGDLEAEQRDGRGPWERNDRLLAVAQASKTHAGIRTIADVDRVLLEAIGAFFTDYNRLDGEEFRVIARAG